MHSSFLVQHWQPCISQDSKQGNEKKLISHTFINNHCKNLKQTHATKSKKETTAYLKHESVWNLERFPQRKIKLNTSIYNSTIIFRVPSSNPQENSASEFQHHSFPVTMLQCCTYMAHFSTKKDKKNFSMAATLSPACHAMPLGF